MRFLEKSIMIISFHVDDFEEFIFRCEYKPNLVLSHTIS